MNSEKDKTYRHSNRFDVIVVGGGHAGCEAAMAAARMGMASLLLTNSIDQLAHMSCNPAIGGVGKGHAVREIDALGGLMAQAIDATGIQFRRLNTRKGPAVWSSRAQADMYAYKTWMREGLETQERLHIRQAMVEGFLVDGGRLAGVRTQAAEEFEAPNVVLTTGTFLGGMVYLGSTSYPAGRAGEPPAEWLSAALSGLGLQMGRLMTCTTPRLDAKTIDFDRTSPQYGDPEPKPFSFQTARTLENRTPCWLTRTNEKTQRVIAGGMARSPMISGAMKGTPPRYCPSIEDKVRHFPNRTSHQVFLEPEGERTREIYANGVFTGLPVDVQEDLLRTIPGLEEVRIMRPGYAIEYDFVKPTQLGPDLMVRSIPGLFLAGQINGTSGYEEAAAQGLVAGINASLRARGEPPLILGRDEAYIGVMVDDLVTKGVTEPYRLFTSRAEHRLLLREDNADFRLMETGHRLGLVPEQAVRAMRQKAEMAERGIRDLTDTKVTVDLGAAPPGTSLAKVLRQPGIRYGDLVRFNPAFEPVSRPDAAEQVEIQVKYEGYIARQRAMVERVRRLDTMAIPEDMEYATLRALSLEIRDRLSTVRPRSLGQASRIPGVTPAAVSALMVYLEGRRGKDSAKGAGRGAREKQEPGAGSQESGGEKP